MFLLFGNQNTIWLNMSNEQDITALKNTMAGYSELTKDVDKLKAPQQPVKAKCGCKHEDRFDCEYMDENKNCAINKKG